MQPADREEVKEVTVAAGVKKTTPAETDISFPPGRVLRVEIRVPPGAAGVCGFQLTNSGQQALPYNVGAFFIGDDETVKREVVGYNNSGRWGFRAFNEDVNAHTFQIRFSVVENDVPTTTAPPQTALGTTGGGEVSPPPGGGGGLPEGEGSSPGETPVITGPGEPTETIPGGPTPELPPEAPPVTEPPPEEEPAPPAAPPLGEFGTGEGPEGEAAPPGLPQLGPEAGEGEGEGSGEPEVIGQEAQPSSPGGKAKPGGKGKPGHGNVTVKHGPKTGLVQVSDKLAGHAEVHTGVAIAVNLIRHYFPGLQVTSTTGGVHAANSLHYTGHAVDVASGNQGEMDRAGAWAAQHLKPYLTEGIHNPTLSVKDAGKVASSFWGEPVWGEHRNHVHLGVEGAQETAIIRDNKPTTTTHPAVKKAAPKRKPAAKGKAPGKGKAKAPAPHKGKPAPKRAPAKAPASGHAKAPAGHPGAPAPRRPAASPHRAPAPTRTPAKAAPKPAPRAPAPKPAAPAPRAAPRPAPAPPRAAPPPPPRPAPPPPRPAPKPAPHHR